MPGLNFGVTKLFKQNRILLGHSGFGVLQTVESWIGTDGWLRKLNYSNRRYAVVDENLTGKGKITRLFQDNGQSFADLEIWVEKDSGEVTVPATATVELPTRERAIEVPQD